DGRVVAGNEQGADRRVLHLEQGLAEAKMVDGAGRGRARRLAQRIVVELAGGGREQHRAAAMAAVGPSHARQQGDRPQRLSAAGKPGHALTEADEGGLRAPVLGARRSTAAAGMPVISATRAGAKRGNTAARTRSKPIVCAAR